MMVLPLLQLICFLICLKVLFCFVLLFSYLLVLFCYFLYLLFALVGALGRDLTGEGGSGGRPVIPGHGLALEGLDALLGTAGRPDLGEPSDRARTGGEGLLLPP